MDTEGIRGMRERGNKREKWGWIQRKYGEREINGLV